MNFMKNYDKALSRGPEKSTDQNNSYVHILYKSKHMKSTILMLKHSMLDMTEHCQVLAKRKWLYKMSDILTYLIRL